MTPSDIRNWMLEELEGVKVHDTTPDLFFFASGNSKFPFATIVTRDDDYDRFSNLDREGVYRLNFATSKETFQCLFPEIRFERRSRSGMLPSSFNGSLASSRRSATAP